MIWVEQIWMNFPVKYNSGGFLCVFTAYTAYLSDYSFHGVFTRKGNIEIIRSDYQETHSKINI